MAAGSDQAVGAARSLSDLSNLPAPVGRNERHVGLVRGPIASRDAAEELLTEATRRALNGNRAKGLMSREWFFRADRPNAMEAIGVDVWFDAEGMQEVYSYPDEMAPLANLFTARPETSVWSKPAGQWVSGKTERRAARQFPDSRRADSGAGMREADIAAGLFIRRG